MTDAPPAIVECLTSDEQLDVPAVLTVNNRGGYVWEAQVLGRLFACKGTKLRVVYCASACLKIIETVPKENVCFRPSAWVGRHHAGHVTGAEPSWKMNWERGSDWIKRGYREC